MTGITLRAVKNEVGRCVITTIAYKEGHIACDSRATSQNLIITDTANKMRTVNGVRFFMVGVVSDFDEFILQYFGLGKQDIDFDCQALVVDESKVYICGIEDKKVYRSPVENGEVIALGSGMNHAITAMDMGCDAKNAVKMAIKRDNCSGGRVRVYKV